MLSVSLVSCRHWHPAASVKTSTVDFVLTCCLHSRNVSSTFGASLFRDHFCVRFRYNLIPRTYPRDRFVGRLQRLDFSPHCYPSYRAPTLTLAGLSPAEHTSLCWTAHSRAGGNPLKIITTKNNNFPVYGIPAITAYSYT